MTLQLGLALVLAIPVGVSLGALGSGGSVVALPVLVYVAGVPARGAVGISLAIVGATSLLGSYLHYRKGHFHLKAAVLLGLSGMAGAYFGSALTHYVSPAMLMLLFGALMLASGGAMLYGRPEEGQHARCGALRCLSLGGIVGVLTGFLGVGGGFLIVPALVFLAGLPTRQAMGVSLAIIAVNSTSGLIGQLRFTQLDWELATAFLALALPGMWLGTRLAGRVSDQTLRTVFAGFVIAIGVLIGSSNLWTLTSS